MKARTAGTALGALAVLLAAGCGGHSAAPKAPVKASSAPPVAASPAANPNAGICRDFETIAGQLSKALTAAHTRPASMTPGERNDLLQAARQMEHWSKKAVLGTQLGILPLDLRGASISAHLLATGYRNPNAASYVSSAASAVAKVNSDCGKPAA